MATTTTTNLGMTLAVPGSNEPFDTADVNANFEAIDAEVGVDRCVGQARRPRAGGGCAVHAGTQARDCTGQARCQARREAGGQVALIVRRAIRRVQKRGAGPARPRRAAPTVIETR